MRHNVLREESLYADLLQLYIEPNRAAGWNSVQFMFDTRHLSVDIANPVAARLRKDGYEAVFMPGRSAYPDPDGYCINLLFIRWGGHGPRP